MPKFYIQFVITPDGYDIEDNQSLSAYSGLPESLREQIREAIESELDLTQDEYPVDDGAELLVETDGEIVVGTYLQ